MARILVVDDEPDVLLLCRVNLSHAGHEVVEADDGPRGLAAAVETLPDLIVLDLMLPIMDGFGVLGRLAEDERTRAIPVLILTAKTQLEDRDLARRGGAVGFLTKPFSPIRLTEVVDAMLRLSAEDLERLRSGHELMELDA
jgi:two-component system response regulator RpaA